MTTYLATNLAQAHVALAESEVSGALNAFKCNCDQCIHRQVEGIECGSRQA